MNVDWNRRICGGERDASMHGEGSRDMKLTADEIARMIDFSAVSGGVGETEIEELAREARKRRYGGIMVLPCHVEKISALLAGDSEYVIGTVIGFPSGANTTNVKVYEARLAVEQGCGELDMVVNVGALRCGNYGFAKDDIRAVVGAADGRAVKVILEVHYLSADQIKRGCEICIAAGAQFVKTATGWAPTGATVENVAQIKSFVGDAVRIKAAGGIRSLDTLVKMYQAGAMRFGIGAQGALKIMQEIEAMPNSEIVF
jgi:deoxyribose-phosphate aldolase